MTEQLGLKELENCLKPLAEGVADSCKVEVGDQEPLALWHVILQVLAKPEFADIEAVNAGSDDEGDAVYFYKLS